MRLPCAVPTIFLLFVTASPAAGQAFVKDPYGIPVTTGNGDLEHPFLGGLYNPIHQFVDIDGDADLDLVLLDVNDGSLMVLHNTGTPSAAAFRWIRPGFAVPRLSGWFRFVDLNADGKPDLLTAGDTLNTAALYLNTGTTSVPLFTLASPQLRDALNNPVYIQQQCIPAFADIDADADVDLFSLNPSVGTINFYENSGTPQDPLFTFRTDYYQEIQICTGCGPDQPLHGQGTMYFADVDGDADPDMFYGDLFDPGLFFYRNIGTPFVAVLDSVSGRFPPVQPIVTAGFNQPTLADIDGDGDADLFVSVLPPFQQINTLYFYENIGTPGAYEFNLVTREYVATYDAGLQSAPAAGDIDADGDPDLFVGDLFGRVAFLRNTGTMHTPAYVLEDSAFIASTTRYTYAPALADPDGDGDLDLFLGHFGGSVEFHRNDGTPAAPQFQRVPSFFDSIAAGSFAAPVFGDLDADGDLDLLVGRGDGRLAFYRNTGTVQAWSFQLVTAGFQNIEAGENAKPALTDADGDGDADLVIGNVRGELLLFRNDGPPAAPVFVEASRLFGTIDVVAEAAPAFVDVDGDGDSDMILGSLRGGLEFYRNMVVTSSPAGADDAVPETDGLEYNYPNPFNGETRITYRVQGAARPRPTVGGNALFGRDGRANDAVGRGGGGVVTLKVYDILGREVAVLVQESKGPGEYAVTFDARGLPSGVYICVMGHAGRFSARKLLLLR